MHKIIERRRDSAVRMDDLSSRLTFPHLKPNIATVDKPPLSLAIKDRYSRLHKHKIHIYELTMNYLTQITHHLLIYTHYYTIDLAVVHLVNLKIC